MSTYFYRFFIFWYICGVVLVTFDLLPPWLEWANSVFLLTAGGVAGVYFIKMYGWARGIGYSLIIIVVSIYVEHLGVSHNFLFGAYHYTENFGLKIADTPITIGFAWLLVIGCSHELARVLTHGLKKWTKNILFILTGAWAAVTMDLILDPVSYKVKEYWIWEDSGFYYDIPFSNFFGWFVLAALFHLIFLLMEPQRTRKGLHPWPNRMALMFGLIIFLFLCIAFTGKLYGAVLFVSALTILWYGLYFWRRSYVSART